MIARDARAQLLNPNESLKMCNPAQVILIVNIYLVSKVLSVKQEMEMLRNDLNITDNYATPDSGESLRDFYRFS